MCVRACVHVHVHVCVRVCVCVCCSASGWTQNSTETLVLSLSVHLWNRLNYVLGKRTFFTQVETFWNFHRCVFESICTAPGRFTSDHIFPLTLSAIALPIKSEHTVQTQQQIILAAVIMPRLRSRRWKRVKLQVLSHRAFYPLAAWFPHRLDMMKMSTLR